MEEYITIIEEETAEITEKKSKFIANIYHIENIKEAEEKIKEIKKKYYDARHNCIAYRVIENNQIIEKSNDDGEPSGTAGAPMLNIIKKNNLCNILIIVTRYFGGILLGTGGLVRAYSEVTQKAIENSELISMVKGIEISLKLDYSNLETFKYYFKNYNINIVEVIYSDDILLKIQLEKNRKDIFIDEIQRKIVKIKEFQIIGEKFVKTTGKNYK